MDVITIESKAYHELMGKIEKILRYVEKEEKAKTEYENRLITNEELAGILGISKRILQRMRSSKAALSQRQYQPIKVLRLCSHSKERQPPIRAPRLSWRRKRDKGETP